MIVQPSKLPRLQRRSSRGFTLVELVAVVVIVGITAALAAPSVGGQIRERRARDTAQRVALLYSSARMRALGRGSAVRVQYDKLTGFKVLESIEGTQAVDGSRAACADQPGLGCLTNNWQNPGMSRQVATLVEPTDITIEVMKGDAAKDNMDICFTPMGRSFISYDGQTPTAPMAGAATLAVYRTRGGKGLSYKVGLLRNVVVLPNGMARLAL